MEPCDRSVRTCCSLMPRPGCEGVGGSPLPRSTYHAAGAAETFCSLGSWSSSHLSNYPISGHFAGSLQVPLPFPHRPLSTRVPQGLGSGHVLFSGSPHSLVISFRPVTLHSSYVNSQTYVFSPDLASELETHIASCLLSLSTRPVTDSRTDPHPPPNTGPPLLHRVR